MSMVNINDRVKIGLNQFMITDIDSFLLNKLQIRVDLDNKSPYIFIKDDGSRVSVIRDDETFVIRELEPVKDVIERIKENVRIVTKETDLDHLDKPLEDIGYISQKGGFLIYAMENALINYAGWSWITYGFIGLLELIDIGIGIAAAIPGLQAVAGAGFIMDAISIVYAFLRLDWYGVIGGLLSVVPLIGDIGGGLLDGTGIYRRITRYARKAKAAKERVDDVRDILSYIPREDEEREMAWQPCPCENE